MEPVLDKIVIKRDEVNPSLSDKADLILPNMTLKELRRQTRKGTVIAIGPGRWGIKFTLEIDSNVHGIGTQMDERMHGHGEVREKYFRIPMVLKIGDRVVWGPYTEIGTPEGWIGDAEGIVGKDDIVGVDYENKDGLDLVILREVDVLATIEEEE